LEYASRYRLLTQALVIIQITKNCYQSSQKLRTGLGVDGLRVGFGVLLGVVGFGVLGMVGFGSR
jgi:hypothetical protein